MTAEQFLYLQRGVMFWNFISHTMGDGDLFSETVKRFDVTDSVEEWRWLGVAFQEADVKLNKRDEKVLLFAESLRDTPGEKRPGAKIDAYRKELTRPIYQWVKNKVKKHQGENG
jgi:hypothetical protein